LCRRMSMTSAGPADRPYDSSCRLSGRTRTSNSATSSIRSSSSAGSPRHSGPSSRRGTTTGWVSGGTGSTSSGGRACPPSCRRSRPPHRIMEGMSTASSSSAPCSAPPDGRPAGAPRMPGKHSIGWWPAIRSLRCAARGCGGYGWCWTAGRWRSALSSVPSPGLCDRTEHHCRLIDDTAQGHHAVTAAWRVLLTRRRPVEASVASTERGRVGTHGRR
jgi:hypothetical protein